MPDQSDVDLVIAEAKDAMEKAVKSLRHELQRVRTGRANAQLLDGISVDYYGTPTPLNQMANLTVPDPRLIVISPYDKSVAAGDREGDPGLGPRAHALRTTAR